ncbi:hypothetical protein HB769_14770, partial [Listeria welshimeri]|nr:hypothetical protein [Listeria welshimeri]
MQGFFEKGMLKYPLYGLIAATIILCVITFFYEWWLAVIIFVAGVALITAMFYFEHRLNQDVQE